MGTAQRMSETLFKIFRPDEWQDFRATGIFAGSAHDLRDGYIHLSGGAQLERTLIKHFAQDASVVVAEIDVSRLNGALRWEPAADGALFPHLFAPLRMEAVVRALPYVRGADGLQAAEAVAP